MKIIDCNCSIGYSTVNHTVVNHENFILVEKVKQAKNAAELLEELDFCGIDSAVVFHQTMVDVSPTYGNEKILNELKDNTERFIPTWTLLPSITDEEFAPEEFLKSMKEHGVKMLRAYPERNRYLLNSITMGEILDEMVARKIPVYLSPESGWEYIYYVLKEYPELTVIINNYGLWSVDRFLYPLLRAYPNVYIETSDYQTSGAIEKVCGKFGSEKLLFGSNFPVNNVGGPLATLFGARISNGDKENISYRNIERILEEVRI